MKHKIIILLLITVIAANNNLLGNNDPIFVTTTKNNKSVKVQMNLEIDGAIKLYSALKKDADMKVKKTQTTNDDTFIKWVLHPDKDFYIGVGNTVELITPSNFKQLAKKYFVDTPELAKSIGKRGFRYKNLPSMIIYYNKKIAKEGGLTKADILYSYQANR